MRKNCSPRRSWDGEGSRTRKGKEPGSQMKPNPFCFTSRPIDLTTGQGSKRKWFASPKIPSWSWNPMVSDDFLKPAPVEKFNFSWESLANRKRRICDIPVPARLHMTPNVDLQCQRPTQVFQWLGMEWPWSSTQQKTQRLLRLLELQAWAWLLSWPVSPWA